MHFYQGEDTSGHIVVKTIYTSHIDHFTPQHTAFEQSAACQSVFLELLLGLIAFATFQKFSHLNALGSKFDLDVK